MKKDNKGFTLIELLIVIAIILSITAIGVVSFLNISKARKQEAYEDVKEQVVTAAEQYFSSNVYYLNDLTSGTIQVGVGKLVEEDYMNTVVNPVTGNKLNICDKIVVTKEGSRVNYEYIETNDSTCDGGNVIAVREAGAPEIKLSYWSANDVLITNTVDLTKWINYKILKGDKFRIHIDVLENGNGKIANLSSSHSQNLYKSSEKFANQYFTNGVYNVTYTATNSSGKTATVTTTFKIDTTAPVVSIYGKKDTRGGAIVAEGFNDKNINNITNMYTENTWTNNDVVVYSMVDEKLSGYTNDCTDSRVTDHFKWWKRVYGTWEGEFKFTCKATDGAGNVSEEANFIVKRDITAPVISISDDKESKKTGISNYWFKSGTDVAYSYNIEDNHSGLKEYKMFWNKTNLTSTEADSDGYKWKSFAVGYPSGGFNPGNTLISGKSLSISYNTSKFGAGDRRQRIYVWDVAGNYNSAEFKIGIEEKATLNFDADKTNITSSTRKDLENGNARVFKYGYGFGQVDNANILCRLGTYGTEKCPKDFFAISCMYIKAYYRHFLVNSLSAGGNDLSMTSPGEVDRNIVEQVTRITPINDYYNIDKTTDYSGYITTSHDQFQYISPAGNESNIINLYVQYTKNCGYKAY